MYSIHSIGAIFNLCFIDEKNVVQINQGGNLANLIRNWATEIISGNGKKKKKSDLRKIGEGQNTAQILLQKGC